MRAVLRTALVIALLAILAVVVFGWWTGTAIRRDMPARAEAPAATTGTIDVEKARERGAELGEEAAKAAATIQATAADAELTSKIKAKLALDDYVRARDVGVSTRGSVVTLSGTVRSSVERERAVKIAGETAGVIRVIDRLAVRRSSE
jgi:hyperosmotically inducible protein